jgi:hypothetical protein
MKTRAISLVVLLSAALLTGCGSGEPSETEMYEAMQQTFLKTESGREDFKKGGCEKTGENTYKCSFGSKKNGGMAMNLGFTKIDGHWQATAN